MGAAADEPPGSAPGGAWDTPPRSWPWAWCWACFGPSSPAVEATLELGVAAMLLMLGARALYRGMVDVRGGPDAWHAHGHRAHHHPARAAHLHVGRWIISPRSFFIGIVHGLAGSGTLVALAMSELDTLPARLLYVALFGFGSIAAMAALSGLAGWPLSRLAARPGVRGWLQVAAGTMSVLVGGLWGWAMLGRGLAP
ncbi:MAG: hypothetical protein R2712_10075 [Vicinamibacterales bacterium]